MDHIIWRILHALGTYILKIHKRDEMTKYFVPEKIWPGDKTYPPYVSGGGFVMTRNLALKLAQVRNPLFNSLANQKSEYFDSLKVKNDIPIIPIDDAYLGCLIEEVNKRENRTQEETILCSEVLCDGFNHG